MRALRTVMASIMIARVRWAAQGQMSHGVVHFPKNVFPFAPDPFRCMTPLQVDDLVPGRNHEKRWIGLATVKVLNPGGVRSVRAGGHGQPDYPQFAGIPTVVDSRQ